MAEGLDESIKKLRKKSRILLARVGEKSKRVDAEVKKLHSQTLSFINCHNRSQGDCVTKNTDSWKIRNDSSEMSAVLCPNNLLPDMMPYKKLILTSKKSHEPSLSRKPVKECYCYFEGNNKSQSRIPRKATLACHHCSHHCKSHPKVGTIKEAEDKTASSPPISCETVRRIKKINYMPTSQFLQNVQNKIYDLQSGSEGDRLETCPRLSKYHKYMTNMKNIISNERISSDKCKQVDNRQTFPTSPQVSINSLVTSDSEHDNGVGKNKGIRTSSQRPLKSKLCKTAKSRRRVSDTKEQQPIHQVEQQPALSNRSKQGLHLSKNCQICQKQLTEKILAFSGDARKEKYDSPRYYSKQDQCLKHDDSFVANDAMDQEVANLKQFREQNYFETHGSSQTLASCKSMGSLQQYLLNQRLFAEPVGRIHKQDLVVTIPPCATVQNKRIHYFPRYVVRQEKNMSNMNYKRKRCQSCPLTGHAIDLGILKTKPLLNSLALKYQKRVP